MKNIFLGILFNLTLLTSLIVTSNLIYDYLHRKEMLHKVTQGLLFGLIGFIAVKYAFVMQEGLIFDGRSIVISICAFLYGPLAGLISTIPPLVLRFSIGGIGMVMVILSILVSFLVGTYFHYKFRNEELKSFQFLELGFITHLFIVALIFTLPKSIQLNTLKIIGPIFLTIFPIISFIVGHIVIYPRNLKKEKERFEFVLKNPNEAILIHSKSEIIFANYKAVELFEVNDKNDLINNSIFEFVHPDFKDVFDEWIKRSFEKRVSADLIYMKILTKRNKIKEVLLNAISFDYMSNPAVEIHILDVTELYKKRKAQEIMYQISIELNKSQNVEEFISSLRDALSGIINTENFFIAFYDERTQLLKTSVTWDEKDIGPDTWSAKESLTGKVVELKSTLRLKKDQIEYLINSGKIKKIGEIPEVWLGIPLISHNKIFGVLVTQDYNDPNAFSEDDVRLLESISNQLALLIERKIMESKLQIFYRAVENAQISIFITNHNGVIEYVNKKCKETTGYSREELIGKNPRILKSGYHSLDFYKNLWETLLAGNDWAGEFVNKRKNGEIYYEKTLITPIKDDKNKITNFVALKEDVTELRKTLKDLKEAKEVAEESLRIMRNFLSMMSHEIRTPMNVILGYLALIRDEYYEKSDEEIKSWFNRIDDASERLLNSATNILDTEKIEMGEFKTKPQFIDLNMAVSKIFIQFEEQEKRKNLKYIKSIPNEKFLIYVDLYTLDGIIYNLISNALKFTKKGEVEVRTEVEDDKAKLIVRDTGLGISEEYQKHLFNIFSQEEVGFSRNFEGTGLGLYLVKKFCDLNKAELKFKSKKGEGTTFEVIFKLETQALD